MKDIDKNVVYIELAQTSTYTITEIYKASENVFRLLAQKECDNKEDCCRYPL